MHCVEQDWLLFLSPGSTLLGTHLSEGHILAVGVTTVCIHTLYFQTTYTCHTCPPLTHMYICICTHPQTPTISSSPHSKSVVAFYFVKIMLRKVRGSISSLTYTHPSSFASWGEGEGNQIYQAPIETPVG